MLVALAACSEFPELEGASSAGSEDAPFLDFLTADQLAALDAPGSVEIADPLAARLARLRSRADLLRAPIFSDGERARLSGLPG